MLFKGSHLRVVDNSGVRLAKCIHIFKTPVARPGSLIVVSIRKVHPSRRVKKGEVYPAVVVQSKFASRKFSSSFTSFNQNSIVLLKKGDVLPYANRISHFIAEEVRFKGFYKIASLAPGLLLSKYTHMYYLKN